MGVSKSREGRAGMEGWEGWEKMEAVPTAKLGTIAGANGQVRVAQALG